ncbi:MAG: PaaI family thioesterase [Rubrivivax sp.]|nr:PaaI family thioesterase [Rubrivivax sp.]
MKASRRPFPRRIPFVEELGLELWGFGGGQAELRLDLAEAHLNYWDVAHGGVLMTLLDVAMAHAARSVGVPMTAARSVGVSVTAARSTGVAMDAAQTVPADAVEQSPGVATIEMKTSFMRPAEGRLRAVGSLLHRTATLAFCEGSVFDEAGHLCAHATATFKYLRALPTTGRHSKALHRAPPPPDKERP